MQLRGLNLADTCESKAKIEILIGRDAFWRIIDASHFEKLNNTMTCVPTIFGFALQGSGSSGPCSANVLVSASDVQVLWDLETLDIRDEAEMSVTDREFDLRALWVKNRFCEIEEGVELKVLGLNWNPDKDVLALEVKGLVNSLGGLNNTKRCVLQTAKRIFDPVGLIAPFAVRIKCLLQEIWERDMDWDDDLPEDLRLKWITWCNEIRTLKEIVIPRNCLQDCGKGLAEIHIFCDASLRAYWGNILYNVCR
ncbi:hypothetical protein HNY73_014265 [Argiope bruennichi]|uniref:Reverse transcriptase domain-containing protein n=1 Tax=Argiope bruennichi TaxID=94029 RepID=A0A8T0ENQ6_ARGBR|nr:hypothetical protein HNY73_014265 [Argiope bruennichi]